MSKQTLAVLLSMIAGLVILAVLVDTLANKYGLRPSSSSRMGWSDVNYEIERLPIDGGWLYRDRRHGGFVFVPGAKV